MWHFDRYLKERLFIIYTDYQILVIFRTQQNPKGCKVKWIAELKNYDFKAKYWPNNDNSIADYLFRNPASEPINYVKDEQMYLKFIGVVEYDKNDIWISIRFKSPMKESF